MALVQTSTLLRTENSGSTSTLSYTSNLTAGSLSVLCVGNYPSGITSVSGSTNGAYTQAVTYGDGGNNYVEIWYRANVSAGAETLTITPTSASGNYITAVAQEWSGMATSSPLDRTGTSGTLTVSTSAATTQADEVVFTVAVADAGSSNVNWGTPSGYTLIARENDSNTYTGLQAAQKTVSSTGTQTATHTNSSVSADTIIATFKVATGSTQESRSFTSAATLTASLSDSARNNRAFSSAGALTATLDSAARNPRAFSAVASLSPTVDSAYSVRSAFTSAGVLAAVLDSQYQARASFSVASALSPSLDSQYQARTAFSGAVQLVASFDSQYQSKAAISATASLSAALDAIDGASGEVFASFTSSAALTVSLHSQYEETAPRPSRPHKPRGAGFYQSITGLRIPAAFNAKVSLRASLDSAIQINGTTSSEQARELQSASQLRMNLVAVPLYANKGLIRTYAPRIYQLERV